VRLPSPETGSFEDAALGASGRGGPVAPAPEARPDLAEGGWRPPNRIVERPNQILLVEDDPSDAEAVQAMLTEAWGGAVQVVRVDLLADARRHLVEVGAWCVLLDLTLPDGQGLEPLIQVREAAPDVPIVILSDMEGEAPAAMAVQHGAQDYLIKGRLDTRLLTHAVRYAVERKRAEVRLAHRAFHDPLTGLPNRTLFLDRLARALARLERHPGLVGVFFLDLDGFKAVNDTFGHAAGDDVLVSVARRVEDVLRPSDTVARYGGDEFTILCEEVSVRDDALRIAGRIGLAVADPVWVGGSEIAVSASVGIALTDEPLQRPEALIHDADAAMYRAKETGHGRFEVFHETMGRRGAGERAGTSTVVELETATVYLTPSPDPLSDDEERAEMPPRPAEVLRQEPDGLDRALERGELRLYYQPKVRLDRGTIASVEALVRWAHPERGLLTPAGFINRAEGSGLILPIGAWVLREACRQAARWREEEPGQELTVVVNVSAAELAHGGLPESVAGALKEAGLDPAMLCLEVEETTLIEPSEAVVDTVKQLRDLEVTLAIDNFGRARTLRHLGRVPVDAVSIDRALMGRLTEDPWSWALVAAGISLAHGMGMLAAAEGVERVDQVEELRALGCDLAQGFYFAMPQPPESIGELLAQGVRW